MIKGKLVNIMLLASVAITTACTFDKNFKKINVHPEHTFSVSKKEPFLKYNIPVNWIQTENLNHRGSAMVGYSATENGITDKILISNIKIPNHNVNNIDDYYQQLLSSSEKECTSFTVTEAPVVKFVNGFYTRKFSFACGNSKINNKDYYDSYLVFQTNKDIYVVQRNILTEPAELSLMMNQELRQQWNNFFSNLSICFNEPTKTVCQAYGEDEKVGSQ